jgi:RNA polymerase primary sigma factor
MRAIVKVLKTLTYREREITKLRYGMSDGYRYTAEECAHIFKCSLDEIRRAERRAIDKLYHPDDGILREIRALSNRE